MKVNKWTLGLVALGLASVPAGSQAEEKLNQVWTALSSTTISGYVNTSMHWNLGTGNGNVPNYVYNTSDKQDGFNLNVVDLTIEKAMDEAQWAAGYKVQLWFGPDANTFGTGSSGSFVNSVETLPGDGPVTNRVSLANNSDFAIRQAYVALRAPIGNGLDFKVGVFDGLLGYESHDAGRNPNYTRAYGLALTPHTHTGVAMAYQFCPFFSASAAVGNTVGPAINQRANPPKAESFKAYTAALAITAPESWGFIGGSVLYAGFLNGFNNAEQWDQTSFYSGLALNTPAKNVKVGASFSYLGTTGDFAGNHNYANAWALYTSFQATEKLSLHLRGEYATTDTQLLGPTVDTDADGFPDAIAHGNSKVFALTGTMQYDLWKNVLSRLEVRWDHQAGDADMLGFGGKPISSAILQPTGTKRNSVLIAANIIYQF